MKSPGIVITTLIFPLALSAQESLSLEQSRSLALEHNQKMKEMGLSVIDNLNSYLRNKGLGITIGYRF